MNTRLRTDKNVVLSCWIFTEAQTRNTRLYTHYSFLNDKSQAYVEDDNDILIEDDILKAFSFNVRIYGITAILIDASALLSKRAF